MEDVESSPGTAGFHGVVEFEDVVQLGPYGTDSRVSGVTIPWGYPPVAYYYYDEITFC